MTLVRLGLTGLLALQEVGNGKARGSTLGKGEATHPCEGHVHEDLAWPITDPTQMTMENRASNRTEPVDVTETEFYKETAQKDPKDWDDDRIREVKKDLMDKLRDPNATLIGVCSAVWR